MRPEMGVALEAGTSRHVVPDVVVARHPTPSPSPSSPTLTLTEPRREVTPGIQITLRTDSVRHPFVEIRDAIRGHKLITLIEIVSLSNKKPGPDRRAYEAKQRDILDSDANLIELDLLREGRRLLPYPELEEAVYQLACDYLILLNRANQRLAYGLDYMLYPVGLREPLPCLPVPLADNASDIPLDLQIAMQTIYQRALYRRMIDYTAPPHPPLAAEDAAWAETLLQQAELRPAQDTPDESS